MNKKILILPGDGIGPEVTSSAVEILKFIEDLYSLDLDIEIHDLFFFHLFSFQDDPDLYISSHQKDNPHIQIF